MAVWKLWVVLLLLLPAYNNNQVNLVKTSGREPYVASICTDETLNTITLLVCKISTEGSRGEECLLAYNYVEEFFSGCDSRFILVKENQTIFLHLTNLTAVDSGNYSCECSYRTGSKTIHLTITVEEEVVVNTRIFLFPTKMVVGVTAFIVLTGVVLGFVLRKCLSRTDTSGLSVFEIPGSLDPDDPDDPYITLQQPANDLYQTISSIHHQHDAKTNSTSNIMELDDQEIDGREIDPS